VSPHHGRLSNAAFQLALKLVIMTFPVGISVPHKSEAVNTTLKLVQNQLHRVFDL